MYNIIRINNEGKVEFYSITKRRWQLAKTKSAIRLVAFGALKTMSENTAFSGISSDFGSINTYVIKDISSAVYNNPIEYFDKNNETKRVFSIIDEPSY
jgi:hypothetical protein